ncbi:MAG: flagellar filament capping protein FliD [FCB group bacterium]|nr:flagellar filament capping protein FliD [FCB group bacterium]
MSGLNTISGLASGLNTTDIINATITYARQPAVLMEQNQALKTQEISTFKALEAKLLALQTSIGSLQNESSFSQASISISDDDYLSATADGAVASGNYTLNILSMARNHQLASQGIDDATQTSMGTGTITLALGDDSVTTIDIAEGANSLIGIKNAINDAKAGITASIINDGSSSNSYRLVLTGNETGMNNQISVTSSLTGGTNLDYTSSSFDDPEVMNFSFAATSQVSLGATSAYTGTANKIYTFTVRDAGTQTLGAGNVIIDYTDGTEAGTGSIVVDQADQEIIGPEGLRLSFSDGDLVGGDTFQVTAFSPLLQQASDAQISFGDNTNGGSPILIRSESNKFEDVISGLTLDIKNTTETNGPVTISTGLNTSAVKDNINKFITAYNEVMNFIDEQNTFNSDTEEGGVLLGDATLLSIQSRLQRMISNPVAGLDKSMNTLSAIGIRTNSNGDLALRSSTQLTTALEDDFDAVLRLFVDGGTSSVSDISFMSATSDIEGGQSFDVDITQASTHGYLKGRSLNDPAANPITLTDDNNRLKFRIDGVVSDEIVLSERTYSSGEDLAKELQTKIDADDRIGSRGMTVEWVDVSGAGYLQLTSSEYGSSSRVEVMSSISDSAFSTLGLADATVKNGRDVEGTINGEAATGKGQVLTGDDGNDTTSGLKLKITLDESQLGDGSEGTISISRGFSSIVYDGMDRLTRSEDGVLARKTSGLQKQVDSIKEQIEKFDERLMLRRERLELKWAELEGVLSQLQSESQFLETQLASIQANTSKILGNN